MGRFSGLFPLERPALARPERRGWWSNTIHPVSGRIGRERRVHSCTPLSAFRSTEMNFKSLFFLHLLWFLLLH